MLSAVVTGDWHLDAYHMSNILNPYFDGRTDIDMQMSEIGKPFEYALENGIQHVFVVGDIGHKHVLTAEAHDAVLRLLLHYDGMLDIHILLGNHDVNDIRSNSMSLLSTLAQYKKFSSTYVYFKPVNKIIDGVSVNILPFPYTVPTTKKPSLNFCHLTFRGSKNDNGNIAKGGDIDVGGSKSYWVSGHLHGYQKSGKYVYCGSPTQITFGETLPCGFIELDAEPDPLRVSHKFVNSRPALRLVNERIGCRDDWANLVDEKGLLYKVWVEQDVVIPTDIRVRYPNIMAIVGDTPQVQDFIATQDVQEVSVDTGLKAYLLEKGLSDKQAIKAIGIVKKAVMKV